MKKRKFVYLGLLIISLALSGWLIFYKSDKKEVIIPELGTIEDPLVAYQKTKSILVMISSHFQHSKKELLYLNEFNKTKDKFIKEDK